VVLKQNQIAMGRVTLESIRRYPWRNIGFGANEKIILLSRDAGLHG
jgi:dihydrofolate reductase